VLVTTPSKLSDPVLEASIALRERFQQTPFAALFISSHSDIGALARLAAGGVQHVLVSDQLRNLDHCYAALASSETWSIAQRVWRRAGINANDCVVTLLLAALRLAHEPLSMSRLAAAAQMHERTLRKYCERNHLPSPQWFIGWARCLLAAYYLDERGRSVQSIAEILHFNSAGLLANHLKRYTGCTASELRRSGALTTAARRFEAFLQTGGHDATAAPAVQSQYAAEH
jgi:AraC-like DNA-binding protein